MRDIEDYHIEPEQAAQMANDANANSWCSITCSRRRHARAASSRKASTRLVEAIGEVADDGGHATAGRAMCGSGGSGNSAGRTIMSRCFRSRPTQLTKALTGRVNGVVRCVGLRFVRPVEGRVSFFSSGNGIGEYVVPVAEAPRVLCQMPPEPSSPT